MQLSVSTGDVTKDPKGGLCHFHIAIDRPPTVVEISLRNVRGTLSFDDWPALVEQVTNYEFTKRHIVGGMEAPLGDPEILPVVKEIRSTPTFQLFLGGIDISERIDL